jgi:HlyD family secretion protein
MNDVATPPPTTTVDEFLGTETRPRWRRWAKYWIPALIVIVLAVLVVTSRGDGKPNYITEPVARHALDISVTAASQPPPSAV